MSHEKQVRVLNGWAMLPVVMADFLIAVATLGITQVPLLFILLMGVGVFLCFGFFTLQPNEGRVLILFGEYRGTERQSGWHWTNPLNTKKRIATGAKPQRRQAESQRQPRKPH